MESKPTCPVCGSDDVSILPIPHPTRSMTSEGRIVTRALERGSCNDCGHGFHLQPLSPQDRNQFYNEAYDVGLRDTQADRSRAEDYADHLGAVLSVRDGILFPGMSIVEFDCGTGALLKRMAERWSVRDALGVEPAAKLAQTARRHAGENVKIIEGYAESNRPAGTRYDLAISVNVVEHALDPVEFLAACRDAIHGKGSIAINHAFTIPMLRQQLHLPSILAGAREFTDQQRKVLGFGLDEYRSIEEWFASRAR